MSADPLAAQQFTEAVFNLIPVGESEDCLYLNIYAPSTPPSQNGRAVLFWIHGGKTRSIVKYERRLPTNMFHRLSTIWYSFTASL